MDDYVFNDDRYDIVIDIITTIIIIIIIHACHNIYEGDRTLL